ncbi:hypothetical protein CGC20_7535 [Leishmania donovani]|uniref:Uncharacterized protein n=1 Tax=Leishmania donovani TaxID=5661 RepID=A0A504X569_LEIDO|nr:hypothetical protein CGC20_7535 [Leishmania donovani]
MKQETVCAFPVELFSVSDTGASSSKGACVCAVVALPSRPPKYSLVCYSAQQVTFCVARMSYVDGYNTSLRLLTHASSGHISFSDDADQRWSVFFADAAQQTRFLACCGVSFYALFGAPGASVFSYDVSFPSSSLPLEVGDRAHVSFTSYELTVKDNMYAVGALGEQRGDAAGGTTTSQQQQPFYVFQPSTSAAQLAQGSFGFEGSVVGMREEDVRVFVVPAGFTTRVSDSLANVSAQGLVFVVRLAQVEHVDEEPASARQAADNGQRAPPSVYAATEDGDARQASAPSEQALMVVAAAPTAAGVAPATSSAASAVPAFLSTNGIPAEHMSVLRKIELGVNTAVATARDVHGVTAIFSQDWHRYIERPKPSLLSNRALLEQVQRVVEEEETAQKHLDACDSALQALEARNKELQQRIDRAVSDSQRLLEEKSRGATKAMEARLERERQLVKLKDEIRVKEQTQEDLQRRVAALRSYIDTSSEELRQLQGRFDVHEIQSKGLAERISTIQESLSEERRRSATLASKSSSTEEAICKAQAQHRLADGQLTAARGLAERERLRYLQVMEDERSHRATDADILRKDIVDALDARERQYQVDRCRLAEEQFMRGLRDGKAEGRRVAETDLLGHQDELRLNLQRAKTEVEIRKEEVRRSIESAMALRRTLGGKVTELEAQLASATRKQTNLHYKLSQWQTWCRTARDTVSQHWRALLSYATHPCTQDELLKMMEAVRTAEQSSYASDDGDEGSDGTGGPVRVDLQFQLDHWRQTRIRCIAQRQRWLWDDMLDLYTKGAFVHFDREWLHPLIEAHDATLEAVAQLYAQQHGGRALFDCCAEEAQERWSVQQQWWSTIHEIEEWLAAQRTAQENLKDEEAAAREALWKEYMDGGEAVVQLCASQLRAQVMLLHEEMQARDELVSEEQRRRRLLPDEAQQQWAASCSSALRLFEEEEEAARAGLEAEAYMSYSGLEFQCAYALRAAQQLSAQHVEQQRLLAEETAARQAVMQEASDAVAGVPAPSHGASDAEPPVGPAVALQHVDSSPAPPPPPAVELGFGFADPPRVAWGDHSSGSGGSNRLRDGGLAMTTDTFFSSEPPPLPPPDEADSLAQAVAAPSEQRSASTFHAVATVVAPPPPRCSSHAEFSAAPTLAITAESDDTLPPSSEVAEVDRQHMSDQRSGSSGGESTSSSLRTSSTSAVQRAGDAAALFTALPLQHDSAGREEGAAVDRDSPSSTQRRPLRAFGADSSNIGEDLSGDMSRGQGSQKSPTSVPRRARGPTTKQPAAGSATQKPKLFDSSSDSEHGE